MAVVPLTRTENRVKSHLLACGPEGGESARLAAGGSLLAGALLLLAGKRRAGLVTAGAGTALAILDQQDVVREWWNSLPGYIDQAQTLLHKVEETVSEVATQRERLHTILTR